jgi:hypothetical protein
MNQAHRIRRQRWQVSAPSPAAAFALRSALRQENERLLLPALESAFAAAAVGDAEIHIPRLTLNLRLSHPDRLAEELPEQLFAAASSALAVLLMPDEAAQKQVQVHTAADRLRHYLLKGSLPWFDAGRERAVLVDELASAAAAWVTDPAAGWQSCRAMLPEEGDAAFAFAFRLLQLLTGAGREKLLDAAAFGSAIPVVAALRALAAGQGESSDGALRRQALALLLLAGRRLPGPGSAVVSDALLAEAMASLDRAAGQMAPEELTQRPESKVAEASPDAKLAGDGLPATPVAATGPDAEPGLPVLSAGLVLLHPFLPRLFEMLDLASADGALSPADLPRAAALLHWLATGVDTPHEFELGLIKLLLGLAPDDPLPVAGGCLGEAERTEGAALLAAAIEHWPALRSTSVDGLRVAFLQRRGLLRPAESGWTLHPECESFDLLLGGLPWGISIVKLPWMRAPIFIEWPSR